jgi:hypothetical protein
LIVPITIVAAREASMGSRLPWPKPSLLFWLVLATGAWAPSVHAELGTCCFEVNERARMDEHFFFGNGDDFDLHDVAQQSFTGQGALWPLKAMLQNGDAAQFALLSLGFAGHMKASLGDPDGASVGDLDFTFTFGLFGPYRYALDYQRAPALAQGGQVTASFQLIDWSTGTGPIPLFEANPTGETFSMSGLIGPGQYQLIALVHGESGHLAGFDASDAFLLVPVPEPPMLPLVLAGLASVVWRAGRRRV